MCFTIVQWPPQKSDNAEAVPKFNSGSAWSAVLVHVCFVSFKVMKEMHNSQNLLEQEQPQLLGPQQVDAQPEANHIPTKNTDIETLNLQCRSLNIGYYDSAEHPLLSFPYSIMPHQHLFLIASSPPRALFLLDTEVKKRRCRVALEYKILGRL